MRGFLLSLFLLVTITMPKAKAGIILWAAGSDSHESLMKSGGIATAAGVVVLVVDSKISGSFLSDIAGWVAIGGMAAVILDEKVSINTFKKVIAQKLSFIDDEDTLDELSKLLLSQYDETLKRQEIKLPALQVNDLLFNAGYEKEEIQKAIKVLSL